MFQFTSLYLFQNYAQKSKHTYTPHHLQIFRITNVGFNVSQNEHQKQFPVCKYSKIDSFVIELETTLKEKHSNISNLSLFRLEKPKTSIRTLKNNPWITDGMIDAIDHIFDI